MPRLLPPIFLIGIFAFTASAFSQKNGPCNHDLQVSSLASSNQKNNAPTTLQPTTPQNTPTARAAIELKPATGGALIAQKDEKSQPRPTLTNTRQLQCKWLDKRIPFLKLHADTEMIKNSQEDELALKDAIKQYQDLGC